MLCLQVPNILDTTLHLSKQLEQAPWSKARWKNVHLIGRLKPKIKDATHFLSTQELNDHLATILNRYRPLQPSDLENILLNPSYQTPQQPTPAFHILIIYYEATNDCL